MTPAAPRAVSISYLPGQGRLLEASAPFILFVAGVAAGKTEGGARWVLKRLIEEPHAVGFVGAQSHAQLTRISLPPLIRLLGETGFPWMLNKAPPESWGPSRFPEHAGILSVQIPGASRPAQIITGSMENYNAHRGLSIGWFWLDEARDMAEEAYDVILSRLRGQPEGTTYGGILTTTPNGFGWLHKRFVAEPVPGVAIVRAKTTENPFLPPGFIDTLRAQYTERFAKQELEGEFLNLTSGQAYYAFERGRHGTNPTAYLPGAPMWYAMDFNVSPLCAGYGQGDKGGARVLGEIYIEGSGRTADATEEFCRRFKTHAVKQVSVFGDMSGANRSTRDDYTDYDIIERILRREGWATTLRRNYQNPPITESVESVNAAFEHNRLMVSPTCKHLIADLEQVSWQEGTRVLDKRDKARTHMSDWLRYYVTMEQPLPGRKATVSGVLN